MNPLFSDFLDPECLYVVEIRLGRNPSCTERLLFWIRYHRFTKKGKGMRATEGSDRFCRRICKKALKRGYRARRFEKRFGRSENYRAHFMRIYPPIRGRYRCVYCGKRVKPEKMMVDHVIPVDAAKSSKRARHFLKHLEEGVNDPENLAPSCRKCNLKKSNQFSKRWIRKAKRGRRKLYWPFVKLVRLLLLLTVLWLIGSFVQVIPQMFD